MTSRRARWAALFLSLLAAVLVVPALAVPAQAVGGDPDPDPSSARELAQQALETVQDLVEAPATPADPTPESPVQGKDLTLALRDLAAAQRDLPKSQRKVASRLLARPDDSASECFSDGDLACYGTHTTKKTCNAFVCVHWVTSGTNAIPTENDGPGGLFPGTRGGLPDYVEFTLTTMTQIAVTYARAGYKKPVSDGTAGGSSLPDVYLGNVGNAGVYGYCTTDREIKGHVAAPAYCVLDNNYAEFGISPRSALRVTAAHEYFHAVQFAYDVNEDAWIMEATARLGRGRDVRRHQRQPLLPALRSARPALAGARRVQRRRRGALRCVDLLPLPQRALPGLDGGPADGRARHLAPARLRRVHRRRQRVLAAGPPGGAGGTRHQHHRAGSPGSRCGTGAPGSTRRARPTGGLPCDAPSPSGSSTRAANAVFSLPRLSAGTYRWTRGQGAGSKITFGINVNSKAIGGAAIVTIKRKNRNPTSTYVALNANGDNTLSYAFGSTTQWIEVSVVNGDTRYRCWLGGTYLQTCQGTPVARLAAPGDHREGDWLSRLSACRTTWGSVVVHMGGRLAFRNEP
ncbi:hypothetical protein G5V59_12145 [Nocardioides sp. W3-2-3]|uniref:MXAN_6640 family putative metalloprotease n=1 Tax=Nocardioides convexus TaxID=2712224 RepID=UPI0024185EF1|nr:MXAN_6640 family putative metalloprotease [Nocardioides convexus]NHA00523.1 hypothetical protein [Nocardioides convexus]